MKTKQARRHPKAKARPPKADRPPKKKRARLPYRTLAWTAVAALAALGAFLLAREQAEGPDEAVTPQALGLPRTPDYHSLLVDRENPGRILLGTHVGVYESRDGGRRWAFAELEGQDAMHLAWTRGETVWAAGHNVLARSTDGGETWTDVRPAGLPGLDVHGFASDPSRPDHLYAAIAGEGLFRTTDGGKTFRLASKKVGPDVMALAVTPDGRLFAGDARKGLVASADGGKTWRRVLAAAVVGVAVSPADPDRLLAAGQAIYASEDGGKTWNDVHAVDGGFGSVAWAPSAPATAYAVGLDRKLYRSTDGGRTWKAVA